MKTVHILITLFLTVVFSSFVSAVSCSYTFIDKSGYNVCYRENVSANNSLNITDNNNFTLLSYNRDTHTDITNTINRDYRVSFSSLNSYNGTQYLIFNGTASDSNESSYGLMFFMNEYVFIVYQKDLYANTTGSMRHVYNTNGISSYLDLVGNTTYYNNQSGSGFLGQTINSVKYITNGTALTNFTVSGQYYKMALSRSYEHGINNSNGVIVNVSAPVNTTDFLTTNQGGMVDIRIENATYFKNGFDINNNTSVMFGRYGGGIIISFNDSWFEQGDALTNNSMNFFYSGLTGFQRYSTSCATSFGSYQHSCTPWYLRDLLSNNYYSKALNKTKYDSIGDLKVAKLSLQFANRNNINTSFMQDYQFDPVTGTNELNNTHTRLVGDSLIYLVQKPTKDLATNDTISIFKQHLEASIIQANTTNITIIPHSTNTKEYYGKEFVINTHSIGTNALLITNFSGYSINSTLLNTLISSALQAYPIMFNESRGNSSYYSVSGNGTYFTSPRYGNAVYIGLELEDYFNFYLHTKNETARNITKRKISEMNSYWNGTAYDCVAGTCTDYDLTGDYYLQMKAHYMNNSYNAFTVNNWLTNQLISPQPYYGWDLIPQGEQFFTIYHPLYLAKTNETYFVDKENGLNFKTPKYAIVSDMKFDQTSQGRRLWIRYTNDTTGSFVNLSNESNDYIYDSQKQRFISFDETLTWSATSDPINYWFGNITSSIVLTPNQSENFNFIVDDEIIGTMNDTSFYSTSSITNNWTFENLTNALMFYGNGTAVCSIIVNCDQNYSVILPSANTLYVLNNYVLNQSYSVSNNPLVVSNRNSNTRIIDSTLVDTIYNVSVSLNTLGVVPNSPYIVHPNGTSEYIVYVYDSSAGTILFNSTLQPGLSTVYINSVVGNNDVCNEVSNGGTIRIIALLSAVVVIYGLFLVFQSGSLVWFITAACGAFLFITILASATLPSICVWG